MAYTLYQGDCLEILKGLADNSVDVTIIDPPYGMGVDHWDILVDIESITKEIKRVTRKFYAVFGVMPYLREWDNQATKHGLKFLEHISWVKRVITVKPRLCRSHEDIYIYGVNGNNSFYKIKGAFEDVKVPGVMFDVVSIEGIKRRIGDLKYHITHGEPRYLAGLTAHHDVYKRLDE
jgi:DNA modification methylase